MCCVQLRDKLFCVELISCIRRIKAAVRNRSHSKSSTKKDCAAIDICKWIASSPQTRKPVTAQAWPSWHIMQKRQNQ